MSASCRDGPQLGRDAVERLRSICRRRRCRERCDVAVIGAGFAGLSAAYHLARRGAARRRCWRRAASVRAPADAPADWCSRARPRDRWSRSSTASTTLAAVVDEAGIDCDLDSAAVAGTCGMRRSRAGRCAGAMATRGSSSTAMRSRAGRSIPASWWRGWPARRTRAGAAIHAHTPARSIDAARRGGPARAASTTASSSPTRSSWR